MAATVATHLIINDPLWAGVALGLCNGTNLLRVAPGQSFFGENAELPETAAAMIRRVGGVEATAATKGLSGVTVRRNQLIDANETGGIAVMAADPSLPATVGVTLARGIS